MSTPREIYDATCRRALAEEQRVYDEAAAECRGVTDAAWPNDVAACDTARAVRLRVAEAARAEYVRACYVAYDDYLKSLGGAGK